jgi:ATP-dependent Clp protease ATP-binding subunit ClpA
MQAIIAGAKEQSKAEAESVEGGGPTVTEQDIAGIVAQWTGIPIEKVGGSCVGLDTSSLLQYDVVGLGSGWKAAQCMGASMLSHAALQQLAAG